jgi:5-methylcytosine-specific restriction endonuclease McrA
VANRWRIPKDVEKLVKERDLNCVYCGISFTNSNLTHKTRPTWEHIINDIRINGPDNIALCCRSCNASKGSKLLIDWLSGKYCLTKGITIDNVATVVKNHLNKQ